MTVDPRAVTPEANAARDAAADGRLLLRSCRTCGRNHYYPRPICPFCFGEDTEWIEAEGSGLIYSFSVNRQGDPYVIAYVALSEGPIMMTNIIGIAPEDVAIDQPVALVFQADSSGEMVAMFRPAHAES